MKVKVAGLAGTLALTASAVAIAAPGQATYKVTGGGQTFASSSVDENGKPTVKGPGDTITFQAFIESSGAGSPATGQVNIIDRTEGAGGKGSHFRGTVTCAFVMPTSDAEGMGYAELHGTGTTKNGTETPFVVRIQDNGQGAAADADMVEFDYTDDNPECDEDANDEEFEFTLARGNAKIHKASPSQSSKAKSVSLAKLAALR
jgi:hypothetical protein